MPKPTSITAPDRSTFQISRRKRAKTLVHTIAYISPMGQRHDTTLFEIDGDESETMPMYRQHDGEEEQQGKIDRTEGRIMIEFFGIIANAYAPSKAVSR